MTLLTLQEFLLEVFNDDEILVDVLQKLSLLDVNATEDIQKKWDQIVKVCGIEKHLLEKIEEGYLKTQGTPYQPQEEEKVSTLGTLNEPATMQSDWIQIPRKNEQENSQENIIHHFEQSESNPSFENENFQQENLVEHNQQIESDQNQGQIQNQQEQKHELEEEKYQNQEFSQESQEILSQNQLPVDINHPQEASLVELENFFRVSFIEQQLSTFQELYQLAQQENINAITHLIIEKFTPNQNSEFITSLEQNHAQLFQKLCMETSYFESQDKEYSKTLKLIQTFQKLKNPEQITKKCNEALEKLFSTSRLASIALYVKFQDIIPNLKDFKILEAKNRTIDLLKQVEVIESKRDDLDTITMFLEENDLENAQDFFFALQEDDGDEDGKLLFQKIKPILQILIPMIKDIVEIKEYFSQIKCSSKTKLILDQLCGLLIKNDQNSILSFKELINIDADIAVQIYPSVLQFYPQLPEFIKYSTIILSQAPSSIRLQVQQVFEIIDTLQSQKSLQSQQKTQLENLSNEIFFDSPEYFNKIFENFFRPEKKLQQVVKPLSLEQISVKSLQNIEQKIQKNNSGHYDITDFMAVISEFDGLQKEREISSYYEKSNTIKAEPLKLLLFDYIKRRCTFSDLINSLSKTKRGNEFTRQIFFNFLRKNSDQYLRTLLYMACSSFMPVPLVSYDWEAKERKPLVCEELFYTFEKYKSVFTFKLSANKNKGPKGCTSLINDLFQKDFEKHQQEMTNFGCIDIQFDYNFASPMCIPVADAHGFLDSEILRKVYILFDIFIIHVLSEPKELKLLNLEIQYIKSIKHECLIIVIQHDEHRQQKNFEYIKKEDFHLIITYPIDSLLEQEKINFRDQIFSIANQQIQKFESYKGDYKARQESMQLFNNFLKNFEVDTGFIDKALSLTSDFLAEIERNAHDLHSEEFLPMNYMNESICQLQSELLRESEIDQVSRDSIRSELNELKEKMKTFTQTKIVAIFIQIIDSKNFLGLISIIAKLLKGLLEKQLNPLLVERTQLRSSLQEKTLDKEQKEITIQNMKDLTVKIEAKWFSTEFVIRELYQLGQIKAESRNVNEELYIDLTELQITQAQPFEIIDGNNLQFISDVYDKIYKDNYEQILVVSIIGPQSSGKSLLLNFLFGTQFQSAAGRCTKGVYASILDIKSSSKSVYKKILILDTEGIQAAEGRDDQFDKRIVFYILCVSHVILICNKGEMNNQMSEVIKLASDAISALKETIVQAPSINIVMNMLAQINESAMEASIQKLSDAILEMDNGEKINQLFQINKDNVFNLPYAFDRSGKDNMIVNQPSQEFTRKLEPLRRKILDRVLLFDQKQSGKFNLQEWFKFAMNFWSFTQTFKGITDYSTLDQKKQDTKIVDKISNLIEENFTNKDKDNKQYISNELIEVLKKYEGTAVTKIETISLEIRSIIDSRFISIQKVINEQFDKFCGDQNINSILRDKRKDLLNRQMNHNLTDWLTFINQKIAVFSDRKSKIIGDSRLQKYINQAIQEKDVYEIFEAEEKFDFAWNEIETEVAQMLKQYPLVFREVFQLIHSHYKNEMLDKHFENIELEKQMLLQYKVQGDQIFNQYIQNDKSKIFFFIGNKTSPNIEKIISSLQLQKQYAVKIPIDLFQTTRRQQYYCWVKVIRERFRFELLYNQLFTAYNHWTGIPGFKSRSTNMIILNQIYSTVISDSRCFDIQPSEAFYDIIKNIDQQVKKYDYSRNSNLDNDKYFVPILQKIVDEIYQNIIKYFQFQKTQDQIQKYHQYFNIQFIINRTGKQWTYDSNKFHKDQYVQFRTIKKDYQESEIISSSQEYQFTNESKSATFNNIYLNGQNNNLRLYFQFLENSTQRINEHGNEFQAGANYFFNTINWDKVIRRIEEIVLENYKVDGKFEKNETISEWVLLLQESQTQDQKNKFCDISRKLIQNIAKNIKLLITQIDEELEPFSLNMSETGSQYMHLIAQTFVNSLAEQLQLIAENQPLEILRSSKSLQQQMFIAKLTSNDKATDSALAAKIAQNIMKMLINQKKEEIKQLFKSNLNLIKSHFKKINIIKNIEQGAIDASKSEEQSEDATQDLDQCEEHSSEEEDNQSYKARAVYYQYRTNYLLKDTYNSTIGPLKARSTNQKLIKMQKQTSNSNSENSDKDIHSLKVEAIKFYNDPKKFLKNMFESTWDNVAEPEIKKMQKQYIESIQNEAQKIILYFQTFHQKLVQQKVDVLSVQLFYNKKQIEALNQTTSVGGHNSAQIDYTKDMKELCHLSVTQYFLGFLKNEYKQNQIFTVRGQTLVVNPQANLVLPEDILIQLDQSVILCTQDILKDEGISMLANMINEFLQLFIKQISQIQQLSKDEIVGELLQDFKLEVLGCEEYCPLCRRQCDENHKESISLEDRIHKCIEGHQIQGFGGNRHFGSNNAITISCSELQDIDEVVYKEKSLKWSAFKQLFKNWNFDASTKGKLSILKEKNVKIWNFIGNDICEYYQTQRKMQINFVKATMVKVQYIHYILLLDRSGSMSGEPWTNLIKAVKQFLNQLDKNHKLTSRVSIIGHDHASQKICFQRVPDENLVDKIYFSAGSNDFDIPLRQAYHWLQKSNNQFDQQVLCFMSDGSWTYPTDAILQISKDKLIMQKLKFLAIGYGASSGITDVLKPMADALGGRMKTVLEPEELTKAFIKLIPNIYSE